MPLIDSLTEYRNSISDASGFINYAFAQYPSGRYKLPIQKRNFITESSFLRIFIAWEAFLESCFIKYMLGELSVLGNIIPTFVTPVDAQHANKLIIGTQKYVDWSNPEIVRRLCNLYFSPGNPFDTFIGSVMADLFDLKTIRNAAAHLSSTTNRQLDSLATRKLGVITVGTSVSSFILSLDPTSAINETILETYLTKLDIVAEGITNG
jgi:hypothetical protein